MGRTNYVTLGLGITVWQPLGFVATKNNGSKNGAMGLGILATARSWKELDLKDEMTSMKWAMVMQKDWAHGIRIQPGDVLVCVWYVHRWW